MSLGSLTITCASSLHWGVVLLLFGGCVYAVYGAYLPRVRRVSGARRWVPAAVLRALGVTALFLLVARPEVSMERSRLERGTVAVLLDATGSMSLTDEGEKASRMRTAAQTVYECEKIMGGNPAFNFQIIPFSENTRLPVSGGDLLSLEPSGDDTDISSALSALKGISPPVSRVVLVSDGNDTTGLDPSREAALLGAPVDCVPLGVTSDETGKSKDVRISGVEYPEVCPLGSVVQTVVNIEAEGYSGSSAKVELKSGKRVLARSEVILDNQPGPQPVSLNFHPETPGIADLNVSITSMPGENTAENNRASFPISITEKLPRVVYVEGSLRPEYKFLRRALSTDPGIEFMSLVRLQGGDFLRQGSITGLALDNLPDSRTELSGFDVLILGDLAAGDLGENLSLLLTGEVSRRLGILILASPGTTGKDSAYMSSPLAKVFPAEVTPDTETLASPAAVYAPGASEYTELAQGLSEIFARYAGSRFTLSALAKTGRIRASASAVLKLKDSDAHEKPVLLAGRFGKGRTALFLGYDSWKWNLASSAGRNGYVRFWGQLVRWLSGRDDAMADDKTMFRVTADRLIVKAGEDIVFSASVHGGDASALSVKADVFRGKDKADSFGFASIPGAGGAYESRFTGKVAGKYRAVVSAVSGDKTIAEKEIVFRVRGGKGEFSRLSPDRALLEKVAEVSGGSVVELGDITRHLEALADKGRTESIVAYIRLWDPFWLFLAFCVFLSGEWIYRKRIGLP